MCKWRAFSRYKFKSSINNKIHTNVYEDVVITLDWLGRMSKHLFELRDDLELMYEEAYSKAPRLGYKLFDEHYSRLHHPYSTLKNRCYTLLEELDTMYYRKFNENPPNWRI